MKAKDMFEELGYKQNIYTHDIQYKKKHQGNLF